MLPMRRLQAGSRLFAILTIIALPALVAPVRAQGLWPWQGDTHRDLPAADGFPPDSQDMRGRGSRGPAAPATYQDGPAFRPEVGVERSELPPVIAGDGSGLPYELWQGIDVATFEKLLADIEIPPRSPALHDLWRRLLTASLPAAASGLDESMKFEAVRLEALYRSGLATEIASLRQADQQAATNPGLAVMLARAAIIEGRDDEGCEQTQKFIRDVSALPKGLASEAVLISGYCVARSGNTDVAGVAAGFAREQGITASAGLAALEAIAQGSRPKLTAARSITPIEYKLLAKAGFTDFASLVPKADPALLVLLSRDPEIPLATRLTAAEAAARLNAVDADTLAELYRAGATTGTSADAAAANGAAHRALLFVAAETERSPARKAQLIRTYLDEARRANLYFPALQTMSSQVHGIRPDAQIGWFAETAIEVLLAANEPQAARNWLSFTSPGPRDSLDHWAALIDISDNTGGGHTQSLALLERRALAGGFTPDQLHRIVTVLDALDYHIPIPLWDAASSTPQPATGHLPKTGVLSQLLNAARAREFGRTVLLTMNAIGPNGAEDTHMIALGDAIRALKSAGLEAEARRLGFEALFPTWPRRVSW